MTTKIQKWGNSQGIRIPKFVLDSVNWNENTNLELCTENNKIIITQTKKRKNIKELFADFEGEYTPAKIDWGEPAGEEIW